ncbi:autoinducer binding domain-containing protein [Caldimonas brevitalea]|uniref:LuxR family transcriptional regulator n=1 Tax=Caldimonas brevitalea TaxID=413882 RepID=A0A0G3BHH9_9BURK|nr:autoinducer binding domain-containing protein [Caldimonas brevitalea]AKJ26806.1 LuxR family transcriptional regulator [Caldimonas brevitalea]
MKAWQEEDIHSLLTIGSEAELFSRLTLTIGSEAELFSRLTSVAQDLGFDFCAYGLRMPLPLSNPRIAMFNNYPLSWQQRYQERGYVAVDPTVHHGMRSSLPLVWSDSVFASSRELWEEARSFGLKVGWALAYRDPNGIRSLLTLSRSSGELTSTELKTKMSKMYWLAQVGHQGMSDRVSTRLMPEFDIRLSERETEVLRWTADGKTSNEVADILNISERTVNFHISNAMGKLGASNKTAAAIRAAVLGFL